MKESDTLGVFNVHCELFPMDYSMRYIWSFFEKNMIPLLLIEENGSEEVIIGVAIFRMSWVSFFSTQRCAYLCTFGIIPSRQRHGFATDLLRISCILLKHHYGITYLTLHMEILNDAAFRFYTKFGFSVKEIIKGYYKYNSNIGDANFMHIDIPFDKNYVLINKVFIDKSIEDNISNPVSISWLGSFF